MGDENWIVLVFKPSLNPYALAVLQGFPARRSKAPPKPLSAGWRAGDNDSRHRLPRTEQPLVFVASGHQRPGAACQAVKISKAGFYPTTRFTSMLIALLEDDPVQRDLYRAFLESAGHV